MYIKDLKITSSELYLSDGTKFMELSNSDDVPIDIEPEISDKEFCRFNSSLTLNNSYVNEELLNKIITVSLSKCPFSMSIPYAVQARKHRKKE